MTFHDPHWLWLLLLIPGMAFGLARKRGTAALSLGNAAALAALPETWRSRCARCMPGLRVLLLALMVLALARPQQEVRENRVAGQGVDLIIALDLSTSMLVEDRLAGTSVGRGQGLNRLDMAKRVLADFLRGRPGDRMGLVVFAARPYPAAPLTSDHAWLLETVSRLQVGAIEDGSALGDAILAALNRLRGKPGAGPVPGREKSQAVILLTDGRSNAGVASPQQAAEVARALGIRIHAIGLGSRGESVIPIQGPLGGLLYQRVRVDLDEAALKAIATTTGAAYFRADDADSLARVFQEIDKIEKRMFDRRLPAVYTELFPVFMLGALVLAMTELTLRTTWLRRVP